MSAAESHSGSSFLFTDIQKRLLRALQDAEKDNNFIYHAKIPEITALTAISKAAVAKSTPISSPMSSQFKGFTLLSYFCLYRFHYEHLLNTFSLGGWVSEWMIGLLKR